MLKWAIVRSRCIIKKLADRLYLTSGRVDALKNIDGRRVGRLVFVCLGNVCRSPYAEVAAQAYGIHATSCGVEVRHSAPAELMAVEAASLRGIDLTKHRSRSIYSIDLNTFDCLVVMAPSQLSVAIALAAEKGCQVTLIGLWCKPTIAEIPDPYGRSLDQFILCFDHIDRALTGFLHAIGEDLK